MTKYDNKVFRFPKRFPVPPPEDAPLCQREGCQNKVKYHGGFWRTYCSPECARFNSPIFKMRV